MNRLACLAILGICFAAGSARASEQEDLARLRQRIAVLQQEMERTSESKSEAADALRDSERAISNSNRNLNNLAHRQQQATSDLAHLQRKSAQLKQDMQGQQAQLSVLLYQQYLGGRQEYLQLLFNNHDPNQAARDLQYYSYIARKQATLLNTLRSSLTQMNELTEQAKQKSDEISALQAQAFTQKKQLEQERHARQQVLLRIAQRIKRQNREIGHLQRNENRLSRLVDKLSQMLGQSGSSPFDALKGKLALPVKGRISNRFGTRRPDGTVLWKGWFLRAPSGQKVVAVAAGQVVFADWLRGFGNLLIIDHGKGYMSLYGNNETLYKQVGDILHGGDIIAAVGNSGGNEDSGLYFELRYKGKPIDPAHWIAMK